MQRKDLRKDCCWNVLKNLQLIFILRNLRWCESFWRSDFCPKAAKTSRKISTARWRWPSTSSRRPPFVSALRNDPSFSSQRISLIFEKNTKHLILLHRRVLLSRCSIGVYAFQSVTHFRIDRDKRVPPLVASALGTGMTPSLLHENMYSWHWGSTPS